MPRFDARSIVTVGCALGAWILMGLSAYAFRPTADDNQPLTGAVVLMLLGGLALGVAIRLAPKDRLLEAPTDAPLTPARLNRLHNVSAGAGLLLALLAAEMSVSGTPGARIPALHEIPISAQFNLWCASIVLLIGGLGGVSFPRRRAQHDEPQIGRWLSLLLLASIVALALGLRVWMLGDTLRTTIDEIPLIEAYQGLQWYNQHSLFTQINNSYSPYTWVYPYLQSLAIDATAPGWASLRLPSAVFGAVSVLALYGLGQALFDRKTALLAAFLLATFPPHLHFSRLALLHIADATFGVTALAFTMRGLKHNRRLDWAAAGAALGLTQYFFEAGRLFFPPMIALWIGWVTLVHTGRLRAQRAGLKIMLLAALGVAAPVYYNWITLNIPLFVRFESSAVGGAYWTDLASGGVTWEEVQNIIGRFLLPFQLYVHRPETSDFRYYGGQFAMVLPLFAPAFLMGMGYMVWRWRAAAVGVVFWAVLVAIGNGWLTHSLVYPRYVLVFAALPLAMAVGLRYGLALLLPGQWQRGAALLAAALALVIGAVQARYYFGPHLQSYNTELRAPCNCPDPFDAVLRAADLSPRMDVYLFSTPMVDAGYLQPLNSFLRPGSDGVRAFEREALTDEFLAALPPNRRYAFFVQSGNFDILRRIGRYFWVRGPFASPYFSAPYVLTFDKQYLLFVAYLPQPRTTGGVVK